jgi:hypothetical protein
MWCNLALYVLQEMLADATFNQMNFWLIFLISVT